MPKYKSNADRLLQRIEATLRSRGRHLDARNFKIEHVIGIAYAHGFTDLDQVDKIVVKDWGRPLGDISNYLVRRKEKMDDLSPLLRMSGSREVVEIDSS